jgi:nucleoside-diphosphate-sugar epimerase
MFLKNFNKTKLLIAGGTGFIGLNVAKQALKEGYRVTLLSKKKSQVLKKLKNVEYINVDIRNKKKLFSKLKNKSFNYVINLSGYINHSNQFEGGTGTFNTHFDGGVNLIDCLNRKKLLSFIQIGSSDEYGSNSSPQKESQREDPISLYSCAKVNLTHLLQMMYKTQNFPVTILRLFLVYGPGQKKNRFIPYVIEGCIKKGQFPVSSGTQLKDFCYIDDVVKAILLSLKNKKCLGEVINIASGKKIYIKKVVNLIVSKIGLGNPIFGKTKLRKLENTKLYADISKAKKLLKWKPVVGLNEGLDLTINSILKK